MRPRQGAQRRCNGCACERILRLIICGKPSRASGGKLQAAEILARSGLQIELDDGPMSALGQKPTYALQQAMSAFTPNSDRESEIPQKAMSALPPKADMCSAAWDVRFGPIADIGQLIRA